MIYRRVNLNRISMEEEIVAEREWPEQLDEIIEEFADCFDAMERYELLFEYAQRMPTPLAEAEWDDQNKVHGCQSNAHVVCSLDENGRFLMRAGADAQLVQGLRTITAIAVNGMTSTEVVELKPVYADAMGLRNTLTPSRANGFLNMFEKVQTAAQNMM